jgi:hypothetical protein
MEHHPTTNTVSGRPFRIPRILWILFAGLLIAMAAIFIFDVPIGTVGYYALFALLMGSHFFMHAGHGRHGGQDHQGSNRDESATDPSSKDEHAGHSGGCH